MWGTGGVEEEGHPTGFGERGTVEDQGVPVFEGSTGEREDFVDGPCGADRLPPFVMKQKMSCCLLAWKLRWGRYVKIGRGKGSVS